MSQRDLTLTNVRQRGEESKDGDLDILRGIIKDYILNSEIPAPTQGQNIGNKTYYHSISPARWQKIRGSISRKAEPFLKK